MEAKNEKMGKKLCPFKCRLQKVALLLSCLALCLQLGNQTIWFQTCLLNMHIFTDLDYSHCDSHPPLYVHFLVWSNDHYSPWEWDYCSTRLEEWRPRSHKKLGSLMCFESKEYLHLSQTLFLWVRRYRDRALGVWGTPVAKARCFSKKSGVQMAR